MEVLMRKLLKTKGRVFLPEIAKKVGMDYNRVWYAMARNKLFPRPTHSTEGMRLKWYTDSEAAKIVALLMKAKEEVQ
jgi:hypothetical protein